MCSLSLSKFLSGTEKNYTAFHSGILPFLLFCVTYDAICKRNKKSGGQPGHKGETHLAWPHPDKIVEHLPEISFRNVA